MAKRVCDACGQNKELSNGKTCDKGHFICYSCRDVGIFSSGKTKCPLCKTALK